MGLLCQYTPPHGVSFLPSDSTPGRGLPQEGFRSSSTLLISLAAPDRDHWSIHEDKKCVKLSQHLTDKCQKRQEKAKAEEVEEEEKEQEKKEEDAPTNTALPDSTASGMEVNDNGEGPNFEEVPPCSDPTSKPLECMLRDMDLEAKDGDLIFPITNVGGPLPYTHELSAQNRERAEVAMKKICSFHLQAVYNTGRVMQVDQILAELLMA